MSVRSSVCVQFEILALYRLFKVPKVQGMFSECSGNVQGRFLKVPEGS